MAESAAPPWDQRPGEPPEAYARFLCYRNLGPGRSLPLARKAHATVQAGTNRKEPEGAGGQWNDDSAEYDWVARATAWDIHTLREQGGELSRLWLAIMVTAARKAAETLADPDCRPSGFSGALAVLDRLAPYMTPDVLRALQPARGDPHPAEPVPPARADVE
jgi:hypothetical protein